MNKKITLSIALMVMVSSQVHATTTTTTTNPFTVGANSTDASIMMPDANLFTPELGNVATSYITALPTLGGHSQFTQQMPNSSMALTTTGPTITPSSSLADSGINTSASYENMAMAQNVGNTHNTALHMLSGNTNEAMYDGSTSTSTLTDSSNNTYTNSANTATNSGSGVAENDSEDPSITA